MKKLTAGLALAALLAGCAAPRDTAPTADVVRTVDGILVDAKGLTLYSYDRDVLDSERSACNGDCAVKWPPLLATPGARAGGLLSLVVRGDGSRQWAYRGQPLYSWPEDQEPGDRYGDKYEKVWHVIRPGEPRREVVVTAADNDGY